MPLVVGPELVRVSFGNKHHGEAGALVIDFREVHVDIFAPEVRLFEEIVEHSHTALLQKVGNAINVVTLFAANDSAMS